jgi:hypothetical protein
VVLVTMIRRLVLLAAARAAVRLLTLVGRELPLGETERRALVERVADAMLVEVG